MGTSLLIYKIVLIDSVKENNTIFIQLSLQNLTVPCKVFLIKHILCTLVVELVIVAAAADGKDYTHFLA